MTTTLRTFHLLGNPFSLSKMQNLNLHAIMAFAVRRNFSGLNQAFSTQKMHVKNLLADFLNLQ